MGRMDEPAIQWELIYATGLLEGGNLTRLRIKCRLTGMKPATAEKSAPPSRGVDALEDLNYLGS